MAESEMQLLYNFLEFREARGDSEIWLNKGAEVKPAIACTFCQGKFDFSQWAAGVMCQCLED